MRSVVQAESKRKAALWVVHQAMQQVLPMESDDSPQTTSDKVTSRGVAVLSGTVSVSERGFDRDDSDSLQTMEVVAEWNQMVTTLDRLERMLYRVA